MAVTPTSTFYPTAVLMMSVLVIVFSLAAGPVYRYGLDAAEQLFATGAGPVALLSGGG